MYMYTSYTNEDHQEPMDGPQYSALYFMATYVLFLKTYNQWVLFQLS